VRVHDRLEVAAIIRSTQRFTRPQKYIQLRLWPRIGQEPREGGGVDFPRCRIPSPLTCFSSCLKAAASCRRSDVTCVLRVRFPQARPRSPFHSTRLLTMHNSLSIVNFRRNRCDLPRVPKNWNGDGFAVWPLAAERACSPVEVSPPVRCGRGALPRRWKGPSVHGGTSRSGRSPAPRAPATLRRMHRRRYKKIGVLRGAQAAGFLNLSCEPVLEWRHGMGSPFPGWQLNPSDRMSGRLLHPWAGSTKNAQAPCHRA